MEVSSEGIANHRIDNILFDYAIFTNLSHEHLNTHKTMHNYFLTKLNGEFFTASSAIFFTFSEFASLKR